MIQLLKVLKFSTGGKILKYITALVFCVIFVFSNVFIVSLIDFNFAKDVPVVLFFSPFVLYSAVTFMQVYYLLSNKGHKGIKA